MPTDPNAPPFTCAWCADRITGALLTFTLEMSEQPTRGRHVNRFGSIACLLAWMVREELLPRSGMLAAPPPGAPRARAAGMVGIPERRTAADADAYDARGEPLGPVKTAFDLARLDEEVDELCARMLREDGDRILRAVRGQREDGGD